MSKQTALYPAHLKLSAKMLDFAGWEMPIHYGSQLKEHEAVRTSAGVFDVSHMRVVEVEGRQAAAFLKILLANNIERLSPGRALYSCMLNPDGGIIDDLIVYYLADQHYRLVVNAGTADSDFAWMLKLSIDFEVKLTLQTGLAIIATQGPEACQKLMKLFPEYAEGLKALTLFSAQTFGPYFIARTGYTGEDGFEWIFPDSLAPELWQKLLDAGFTPCGLGARDTLRLEAGLNLYGADMDETVTPLESNLSWTVVFEPQDRLFIGRAALEKQRAEGVKRRLVGLVLEESGIPRNHQKVLLDEEVVGEVTSGSFSPTLKLGLALARVPVFTPDKCAVEIRGKALRATVMKPPFVKKGQRNF